MRILVVCILASACASQHQETPAPAATAIGGSMPSDAPAPKTTPEEGPAAAKPVVPNAAPSAASPPAPAASGAMTAAEAAANLSAQRGGGAGDGASSAAATSAGTSSVGASSAGASSPDGDEAACATDADCTFTRVAPGACCPMLCAPRAVTKQAAAALDEHMRSCARGHACPQPSCRPPRRMTAPACVQSRCIAKVLDEKGMQ